MYNAMPVEGVNKLVSFMQRFKEANESYVQGSPPKYPGSPARL